VDLAPLRRIPLLAGLDDTELGRLAAVAETVELAPGTILLREGEDLLRSLREPLKGVQVLLPPCPHQRPLWRRSEPPGELGHHDPLTVEVPVTRSPADLFS